MNIAVIGGRDFNDYELLKSRMKDLLDRYMFEDITIVSGGAPGADSLAVEYAKLNGINYKVHEAEWNNLDAIPCKIKTNKFGKEYNCLAGFNRNTLIIEDSEVILAFWDQKSPGTKDSITKAKEMGKDPIIISY